VTLSEVLAGVAGRVPYLRAVTTIACDDRAAAGGDWWSCTELVDNREVLARVVARTMSGFGTDDAGIAASLFTQAYAFRVAGVPLAAYALGLPVPDVTPGATAVRIDKPRPTAVAFLDATTRSLDATELAAAVVDAHLAPFVAAVHRAFRVGDRLLWGNVAASCAVAFRAVEGVAADPAEAVDVRARGELFVASVRRFAGLGAFVTVVHGDAHGWYWDRTNCCLWFQANHGSYCDNCSLRDPGEVRAERLEEVAAVSS
jgi:ferric iron reductase protein FhuF